MNTNNKEIEKLKHELMDRYTLLMMCILAVYTLIFTFYIHDKMMSWYLIGGCCFWGYSYFLVRRKYSINLIVHLYLIIAPLYDYYIILAFWKNSVANFCWLLQIPLGAYIFFSKKAAFAYIAYTLLIIVACYITANNFNFNFPIHSQKEIMFSDTIVFISNILVVTLLIYYKDKIKKVEIISQLEAKEVQKDKISIPEASLLDIDTESMDKLFEKIETVMIENHLFKDVKFNLSKLSVELDVNSTYISKAIRHKGYSNFNTYLNIYRINHVKKLFTEIDFQKTTLMYVYTEAGFSNQSTFNRVFKQTEGITPSEYLQQNLHANTDQ